MLIGAMNHPAEDPIQEIHWMARMGMEFVDLTLEPPRAAASMVNAKDLSKALSDYGLKVIGHTAWYLPIASPFESLRHGAVEELKHCLKVFGKLGAPWMNVHPGRQPPLHDWAFTIGRNLQSLRELLPVARDCGVGLMLENIPGEYNSAGELAELLEPLPEVGLHLDIGHANLVLKGNTTENILAAFGSRLRHVHLHDNKGGQADLHLPLGTGTVDIAHNLRLLRAGGYDGTITLEVFAPDQRYLALSRDILRREWEAIGVRRR